MSFNELGLSPHILRAVKELGYEQPTPIQQQAIPAILAGQDVLGGAQTGTGKTAGFTLPMLQRLLANHGRGRRQVRALVLTPTRELAAQVGESIIKYAHHLPFKTLIAYGGVSIKPNLDAIKLGVDILVATPGRLLDLLTQGALTLSQLEVLVLDEADRMLDMGFIVDIRRIMKALPAERQTLLFSATFSNDIKALADDLLNNPTPDRGGPQQYCRRAGDPAHHSGGSGTPPRAALPHDWPWQLAAGTGVCPHQADRRPPRPADAKRWSQYRGDPW